MSGTFESLSMLDDAALHVVLGGSDPAARLHALWVLAARHGARGVVEPLAREPNAGVRRHLCVALATERTDLLVEMARIDTDGAVRATASTFITRLAAGGRLPWDLVAEKLADRAARRAVLDELTPAASEPILAIAKTLLTTDDDELHRAALEAIWRIAPADAPRATALAMETASASRIATSLGIWAEHADATAIHHALRDRPIGVRLAAVERFAGRWPDLAAVALDPDARVRHAVREALGWDLSAVPIDVLAAWIDDDSPHSWHLAHLVFSRLLAGDTLAEPARVLTWAKRTHAALAAVGPAGPVAPAYEEDDDEPPQVDWLVLLIEKLEPQPSG